MKSARMIPALGIAAIFLGLFAACPSPEPDTKGQPAGTEPDELITIRLLSGSLLETNLVSKITNDSNALLDHMEKYRAAMPDDRPSVARAWKTAMQATYLKDAKMGLEGRSAIEGWDDIIGAIEEILDTHASFTLQRIHVEIEYLAYESEKYLFLNTDRKPGEEIDMIFHIRSTIVHQSDPFESTWEGELPHRRTCDPLY